MSDVKWQGIMAFIDTPSQTGAGGSLGYPIVISKSLAKEIIVNASGKYLCDEHINQKPHFYKDKLIGKIEEVTILDDKLIASGYVKAEWVQANQGQKGLSVELTSDYTIDNVKNILTLHDLRKFAGVAVVDEPAFANTTFEVLS